MAMNEVQRRLLAEDFEAQLMIQVHDELDFSVPAGEVERLAAMDGSRNLGRVVDKLTRDKMVSMWWKGELTDDAGRRG